MSLEPNQGGSAALDALLEAAAASIPPERMAELLRPNARGFRMPMRGGRPWFTDAMQCAACGCLVTASNAERQREGEARHQEVCCG